MLMRVDTYTNRLPPPLFWGGYQVASESLIRLAVVEGLVAGGADGTASYLRRKRRPQGLHAEQVGQAVVQHGNEA